MIHKTILLPEQENMIDNTLDSESMFFEQLIEEKIKSSKADFQLKSI
jgi:hypothetical protein